MIKRPFLGLKKPRLNYKVIDTQEKVDIKEITLPENAVFHLKQPDSGEIGLKIGEQVKTGQRIVYYDGKAYSFISPVTGEITNISEYLGYMNRKYTSITIKTKADEYADEFTSTVKSDSPDEIRHILPSLPGNSDFISFLEQETPYTTIVINGFDKDLLITTSQYFVLEKAEEIRKGLEHLKRLTNVEKFLITVPPDLESFAGKTGAEVKIIQPAYPYALPEMVMKNVLNTVVPAGKSCTDMGVGFINPETLAALASIYSQEKPATGKTLTVIDKQNKAIMVKARIGTPIGDILAALGIKANGGDRIIMGGPMKGVSFYSEDLPISYDSDAIIVQDSNQIVLSSDTPCINCGECIRVCPAKVPINMLVRLLENSQYEDAVEQYDLLSCIECGLCNYVCTARIPLFQYIMLGKYEFSRIMSLEESNA